MAETERDGVLDDDGVSELEVDAEVGLGVAPGKKEAVAGSEFLRVRFGLPAQGFRRLGGQYWGLPV